MNEHRRQAITEACLILGLVLLVTVVTALVASSAEAQRFVPPPGWTPAPPRTPTGGLVLPPDPGLLTEIPLREGSDSCDEDYGRTVTIPSPEAVRCWRVEAARYLVTEVQEGRLRPGGRARGITYPGITWAIKPVWIYGSVAGVPQWACAAGVATNPIQVWIGDADRTLSLVAWETSNFILAAGLDRYDLTDGAVVGAATNAARAACPAY